MIISLFFSRKTILLFIGFIASLFFVFSNVFAETAIIISPTEGQEIVGTFQANIDWTSQGPSATCAYVYDDWNPTLFSSEGWNEVSCESAGADIPAPSTDGQHTLRVAAWLGAGFTSNATSDYVTFTYTASVPFSGAGAGTEIDPYVITTCEQLQEMNDHLSSDFIIGNNIDCVDTESWNLNLNEWVDGDTDNGLIPDPYTGVTNNGYYGFDPIGRDDADNSGSGFTGTLDGQNYIVSDLWIFRKEQDISGLIGYATGATIRNLRLNNARIVGGGSTGGFLGYGIGVTLENLINNSGMVRAYLAYNGGGIAGQLENSSTGSDLSVVGGDVHGSGNIIGGLVGRLHNSSVNASNTSADVDGGTTIGGAFGYIDSSQVSNIESSGSVHADLSENVYVNGFSKSGNYSGGFAGRITTSSVSNVFASNVVTSEGNYSGGFAGDIIDSTVIGSIASGNVSAEEYVGGFAGVVNNSAIENSSAFGDVSSVGSYAGGFSGQSLCGSEFLRTSAFGDVQAGNVYVGGFTGFDACEGTASTFTQASAHGDVQGNNLVGGFVGESNLSTFINAYSSGSVSANDQVGSFGGVVTYGSLDNVYASGAVILLDAGTLVGGFINNATDTTIADSFWDGELITETDACNTGVCAGLTELTTEQAKTQSTYTDAGWDFDAIWEIGSDNDGYPYFSWENFNFGELLGSGTEEDPWQVTQCLVITESGYYELQNNITDVIGDCIVIEASDVFFDGGAFSIGSDGLQENQGVYSFENDRISISNITIDGFYDGVMLLGALGDSSITNVTITNTGDDAIDLQGVSDVTITNVNITDVNDDGIQIYDYFNESEEEYINNFNIIISGVVINGAEEDHGIDIEDATGVEIYNNNISNTRYVAINIEDSVDVNIYENELSDFDAGIWIDNSDNVTIEENTIANSHEEYEDGDGMYIEYSENVVILNNSISDVLGDGMYIEDVVDLEITGNTFTNVNSDAVDLDDDNIGTNGVEISNNTFENIGDRVFEVRDSRNLEVLNNTAVGAEDAIYVQNSEHVVVSGNTFEDIDYEGMYFNGVYSLRLEDNTLTGFGAIDEGGVYGISLNETSPYIVQNNEIVGYEGYDTYGIYAYSDYSEGEDELVDIEAYSGEYVWHVQYDTDDTETYLIRNADLTSASSSELSFYSAYETEDCCDYLTVSVSVAGENDWQEVSNVSGNGLEWQQTTYDLSDFLGQSVDIRFRFYTDGSVLGDYGVYVDDIRVTADEETIFFDDVETLADGWTIDTDSGRSWIRFNTTTQVYEDDEDIEDFELVEGKNILNNTFYVNNYAVYLEDTEDVNVLGNTLRSDNWVNNNSEGNVFNDSDSGNTYLFANGTGAWTVYNITDSNSNGYAEQGTDRPFSQSVLGEELWNGQGQDAYPATETTFVASTPRRSGGRASSALLASLGVKVINSNDDVKADDKTKEEKKDEELCPADQILTQNLRSGARNGRFNAYTGGIVTQANRLQAHLNRLGFNSGPVDGILGRLSDGAIKRMQTFLGTKADGFVGPITRGLINKSCGSKGLQS